MTDTKKIDPTERYRFTDEEWRILNSRPEPDTRKIDADAIMQDRSQDYGDASINWASQTKIIQAMVEQAIQMKLPVDLPPQFAAWVMVTVKGLRDVYKSKEDNYLDAMNYVKIAEKTK